MNKVYRGFIFAKREGKIWAYKTILSKGSKYTIIGDTEEEVMQEIDRWVIDNV